MKIELNIFLYFVPECAHSIYCYCILLQRALMNGWALGDPFLIDWFFLGLLLIKSRFPSFTFLDLDKGVVQKWSHPLRGKGRSAKRWCYSISLFSKMGDKGEGGVKNWVTSFMDGHKSWGKRVLYKTRVYYQISYSNCENFIFDASFYKLKFM